MRFCTTCFCGAIAALGLASHAAAQSEAVRAELKVIGTFHPPGLVAATVAGKEIDIAEVNRLVKISLRGRPASGEALAKLQAAALEQVVNRELVRSYLDRKKVTVSDEEIDKAITNIAKAMQQQGSPLVDELGRGGLTMDAYRKEVEWELRWTKHSQEAVTDTMLQTFFDRQHADFDGTEIRVSHILLRPDANGEGTDLAVLAERADIIRNEILSEISTFADAAKKYSAGPSRHNGGDLGFIKRHGVMPEEFCAAAFQLKKGEISPPVKTALGVHIIQCTDIHPGKKTWRDVRKELEPTLVQTAFREIAKKMRTIVTVEYSDKVPHLDPESGELVQPAETSPSKKDATAKN